MTLEEWIYEQENRELHGKPEETKVTTLQREYMNGYLDGQKKAYDRCDEIARELSQIKSGYSQWIINHDAEIREDVLLECMHALDNSKANCHEDYIDGIDFSIGVLSGIYEQLKENKNES